MKSPLEHFSAWLDAAGMVAILQQHLPECAAGRWRVTACEIQHPRYKTYRENCDKSFLSLVYHLRGKPSEAASRERKIFYVRAYLGDRSRQVFEQLETVSVQSGENTVLHFPALGMLGWRFPNDPAMPWLAELMDVRQAAALMPVDEGSGGQGRYQLLDIEIVNYRPEVRCTAKYRLKSSLTCDEHSVYGKIYADGKGQRIYQNLRALYQQSRNGDAFLIPRPMGYDPSRHSVWMQDMHGAPLKSKLFNAENESLPMCLSQALSHFHSYIIAGLPTIGARDHLREWQKKARKLAYAYPKHRDSLCVLLRELIRGRPEFGPPGLIHGDFHVEQVNVMPQGGLALYDFDELAMGDPLQDIANFCADLYTHKQATAVTDRLIQKFYLAYCRVAPASADTNRFYWHLRGQLLTRAYRAHIQQQPMVIQRVEQFILLALRAYPTGFPHLQGTRHHETAPNPL